MSRKVSWSRKNAASETTGHPCLIRSKTVVAVSEAGRNEPSGLQHRFNVFFLHVSVMDALESMQESLATLHVFMYGSIGPSLPAHTDETRRVAVTSVKATDWNVPG